MRAADPYKLPAVLRAQIASKLAVEFGLTQMQVLAIVNGTLRELRERHTTDGVKGAAPAERDWCTDPDNCPRCKAATWDQANHRHAGIPTSDVGVRVTPGTPDGEQR